MSAPKKASKVADVELDESDVGITLGSGNVFADMGEPDAEVLHFKARLICEIQRAIDERGLTQTEAAAITGMDQPTLSKL
ncbi:MAG: helix-turn-helix domain-containing protein, partial [Armatimonadota bacterium]|nr:helix-turn-helix domain-containing protein [Armatimonadota bacterium]